MARPRRRERKSTPPTTNSKNTLLGIQRKTGLTPQQQRLRDRVGNDLPPIVGGPTPRGRESAVEAAFQNRLKNPTQQDLIIQQIDVQREALLTQQRQASEASRQASAFLKQAQQSSLEAQQRFESTQAKIAAEKATAASQKRERLKGRTRRRLALIKTGSQGVLSSANTAKRKLLGN